MTATPSSLIVPGISRTGQPCVFKQLRPEHRDREDLALRLDNERHVLQLLRGVDGVIALLEVRRDPLTLVLERADCSLDESLANHDTALEAAATSRALLQAIDNVHLHGVIHRDIKPSNILLIGGRVCLADFGVAAHGDPPRALPDGWEEDDIGTPPWSAPEQRGHAGDQISFAADVYSASRVVSAIYRDRPLPAEFRRAQHRDPRARPAIQELIAALAR